MRARAQDIKISIFEMQMEYKYLHKHEQLAKENGKQRPTICRFGWLRNQFFFPLLFHCQAETRHKVSAQCESRLEDNVKIPCKHKMRDWKLMELENSNILCKNEEKIYYIHSIRNIDRNFVSNSKVLL